MGQTLAKRTELDIVVFLHARNRLAAIIAFKTSLSINKGELYAKKKSRAVLSCVFPERLAPKFFRNRMLSSSGWRKCKNRARREPNCANKDRAK